MFWLTLRLFMKDKRLRVSNTKPSEAMDINQSTLISSEDFIGSDDNVNYKRISKTSSCDIFLLFIHLVKFLNEICEKYWILVCCFAMLFVSIQSSVVLYRIIYMLLLMYFLITFMVAI